MKIEINFPMFEGFYNSHLDLSEYINDDMTEEQFESINWQKTNENICIDYLDYFKDNLKDFFKEIGVKNIDFVKVESPKYYNYTTDNMVCNIEIDKNTFIHHLRKLDFDNWTEFLENNFKSYDGFMSFYSYDTLDWDRLIIEEIETNNVIVESLLKFYLLENEEFEELKEEYLTYIVPENVYEFLDY